MTKHREFVLQRLHQSVSRSDLDATHNKPASTSQPHRQVTSPAMRPVLHDHKQAFLQTVTASQLIDESTSTAAALLSASFASRQNWVLHGVVRTMNQV